MALYAIGDLHLSLANDKPMDVFGDKWKDHAEKLKQAGADVEINETRGTYHGYDAAIDAQIVRHNVNRRISFLRDGFKDRR